MIQDRFKYRAWNKKRKRMYEVLHLHTGTYDNGGDWATVKGFNIITQQDIHIQVQPKDCILMQCTGRCDDKKQLIYEDDIVNGHCGVYWGKMLVIWDEISAAFCFKKLDKKGKLLPFVSDPMFVEILGNKYENPELLEGTDENQ